jgi:nicotinamidase-related amidase
MKSNACVTDHTALLIVDPYNDFMSEGGKLYPGDGRSGRLDAAHEVDGPSYAHAILITEQLLAVLPANIDT